MYFLESSHLKEGSCYIHRWNDNTRLNYLEEVSEQEYQEYNAKDHIGEYGRDQIFPYMGIDSIGEILPSIHWLLRIPVVTEVEAGSAWEKNPHVLYSFKVLHHLSREEVNAYIEENRETLLSLAEKNQDQGTIEAFDDYDYLKAI